jgi:hypothetical protein
LRDQAQVRAPAGKRALQLAAAVRSAAQVVLLLQVRAGKQALLERLQSTIRLVICSRPRRRIAKA